MKNRIHYTRSFAALSGVFLTASIMLFLFGINHPIHRLFQPTIYPNMRESFLFMLLALGTMAGANIFERRALRAHKALKLELRDLRARTQAAA
jgi:hypothetical protein